MYLDRIPFFHTHKGGPEMAKIVIVSSSCIQLQILELTLRDADRTVVCYCSAVSLEQKIMAESPDLLLMDATFEGGNGFQTCVELRKSIRFKELPIILCGDCDREDDKVWAIAKGATEYLYKPLDLTKLLTVINSHLGLVTQEFAKT